MAEHFRPDLGGSTGPWRGKSYNFFGDYLWDAYRCRVLKLPISAGLSCPNRDGTLSRDGCIFCSPEGSASPGCDRRQSIAEQMHAAKNAFRRADPATRYIAYFQAFSNTYADTGTLKQLYDTALASPEVIGMMIGTRPDCLDDAVIDLIAGYMADGFELWIELGMQTMHDTSLAWLNRGHDHATTRDAIHRIAKKNIPVCAHIILGIPGEDWGGMMATAREIASLPVAGVKIHQLHVIKGTALETLHRQGGVPLPSMEAYCSLVCDFLERLRPDILVHRLSADCDEDRLIAPLWGAHKGSISRCIEEQFRKRCSWQGFLWEGCVDNEMAPLITAHLPAAP